VGVGDSLEASYALKGPIAAGRWHLVGDGLLLGGAQAVVRYQVLWRAGGDAGSDKVIATFDHRFTRDASAPFGALPYADDVDAAAVPAAAGDLLVLRYSALDGDTGVDFEPNGDGPNTGGAIPHIDLPR
jgi:hypothetical protein